MVYRIMSFDGGGIRGVYTAQLLCMLLQEIDLLKKVDLYVGTSTGSLIALGLSLGYSPEQLVGLYHHFAPLIFVPAASSESGNTPRYTSDHLKGSLQEHVFKNNPTLADLSKRVVIPVFKLYDEELRAWKPTCFHNFDQTGEAVTLVDVVLSACAAPMFFSSYQGYIDGGVFANNPSMYGVCEALKHQVGSLAEIKLFSLGTSFQPMAIRGESAWGCKEWMEHQSSLGYPLFSLITEGVVNIAHEQCAQILGTNYHRLNTPVVNSIGIDAAVEVPRLIAIAQNVPKEHPKIWKETVAWLRECF